MKKFEGKFDYLYPMNSALPKEKVCLSCGEKQSIDEFRMGRVTWRVATRCRSCRKSGRNMESKLVRLYGITTQDYEDMGNSQDWKCAICHRAKADNKLHIDHDHKTGKVRGLLCDGCNHGLGFFRTMRSSFSVLLGTCVPTANCEKDWLSVSKSYGRSKNVVAEKRQIERIAMSSEIEQEAKTDFTEVEQAREDVCEAAGALGLPTVSRDKLDDFEVWITEQRAFYKSLSPDPQERWKHGEPTSVSFHAWKAERQ